MTFDSKKKWSQRFQKLAPFLGALKNRNIKFQKSYFLLLFNYKKGVQE